jgi:hypothetical protein
MKKIELWKLVEQEVSWFIYYGYKDDRRSLDMDKPLYDQVRSIGYAKVNTPLDIRCTGLSSIWNNEYPKEFQLKRRNTEENRFTPLETWVLLYPEDKELIYKKINRYE